MRSKAYCINIAPITWQRATRRDYALKTKDAISFGLYLNQQHNDEPFFSNPIHIEATFYMPVTQRVTKDKQIFYHANVPHLENLYKFLLEAMKDVLIADDRVICSLSLKKVYDKEPRTELIITEVV